MLKAADPVNSPPFHSSSLSKTFLIIHLFNSILNIKGKDLFLAFLHSENQELKLPYFSDFLFFYIHF